jgi:hypothetical protein
MSWRIEHSDALTLLRELPSGWAQSCVTSPPRDVPPRELLAVLEQVRRVLRDDGTLWLALSRGASSSSVLAWLQETAWLRPAQERAISGYRVPRSVVLLTKQPAYLFTPRLAPAPGAGSAWRTSGRLGRTCGRCLLPRRAYCIPAPGNGGLLARELIEWCILTSTVPRACGVCGTPWRRVPYPASGQERWRTGCVHINGRGRSLVIDPFCGSGNTGLAAQRRDRDFLGIEQSRSTAALARTRLTSAQRENGR